MRVELAKFEKDRPIWFFSEGNADPTSSCNATIEYGKTGLGSSGLCMRNCRLRALKNFNDFKNVVVKIAQDESVCDMWALTRLPLRHESLVKHHLSSLWGLQPLLERMRIAVWSSIHTKIHGLFMGYVFEASNCS